MSEPSTIHRTGPGSAGLTSIDDRIHVWMPGTPGIWGLANCVLVTSGSEALLVDTPYTAALTTALKEAAARVLPPGVAISTVINTHANGDHSYGNQLFPEAEVISTEENLRHLCAEPEPARFQALLDSCDATDPFGRYLLGHFGRYDFGGLAIRRPTRVFSGREELTVGGTTVELIEVGPAHTHGDLIVHIPASQVVCAGDILFVGDVPVHWAGPLAGVVDACQRIVELRPRTVVPGHGPLVGPAEVIAYQGYVRALRDRVHDLHRAGMDLDDAARTCLSEFSRADLGLTERIPLLVATEWRHLTGDTSPLDLLAVLRKAVEHCPDAVPATLPPRPGRPS
ncbi:MBL fold metallo-hydrolase [Streptomyces sp. NPDC057638]|uniref:MBL fold metallo-hydrolase n=1 Tax=Streptomyces sp. NPDC057638 TaxID=3346190 RepID=UPI003674FB12